MEPFNITLGGEILTVHPLNDETFQVYRGDAFVATLTPCTDKETDCLKWESSDLISAEHLFQIGEAIEMHDM